MIRLCFFLNPFALGNSTLFLNLNTNGPYDCMGDENGNLYVINGNQLRMYDVNGNLSCYYTLVGYNNTGIGGGYSVVNGIVYANNGSTTYKGIINGNTINFTPFTVPSGPSSISDFANCAFPPLNANITYPGNLSCSMNQVPLTVSTTVTNPVYAWTGPGIVSGGTTSVATVNQPGNYSVNITSSGGGGAGCGNSATSSVAVTLDGASNFTGSAACVNNAPEYTGSITVSSGMNTGTMTISSACGGSQTFNLPIAGSTVVNYQFTGTSGGPANCDLSVSFSDYASCNQTIPLANPNCCAVAQPTVDVANPTCSTPGTATVTNYNANYTYTFSPSGPSISSGGIITGFSYGVDYTLSASDSICTVTSDIYHVDSTKTTPSINVTGGTICFGDSMSLTAIGSPSGGDYSWNNGLGTTSTISVSPTATTTYTVTYDLDGCSHSEDVTVNVSQLTTPIFDSIPPICLGTNIILPTLSTNNINGSWSPAFDAMQTTTYTFNPGPNQCASTATKTVIVKSEPDFILTSSNPTLCDGSDGSITISGLDPNTNFTVSSSLTQPVLITSNSSGVIILDSLTRGTYQDITVDWNGCIGTDTSIINLKDPDKPFVDAGPDLIVCPGFEVVLAAENPDSAAITWNKGVMDSIAFIPNYDELFYTVTATKNGCVVTDSVSVYVDLDATPTANFITSTNTISNAVGQVYFINHSENAIDYIWKFGDGDTSNELNPTHLYSSDVNTSNYVVTLIAISDLNCTDSMKLTLQTIKEVIFYVPNTFTPDGDEFNNVFKPILASGYDANEYSLIIYDRWGELIFESHDINIGWDGVYLNTGKVVPDGSYVWKITVKVTGVDDVMTKSGSITVIR